MSVKSGKLKHKLTMATLTKKDLLEAIEDMPMDAPIEIEVMEDFDIGFTMIKTLKSVKRVKDKFILSTLC
jgi:hypothetical protein